MWNSSDDIRSWWDVRSRCMMTTSTLSRWTLLPCLLQLLTCSTSWSSFRRGRAAGVLFATIFRCLHVLVLLFSQFVFLWRQWPSQWTADIFTSSYLNIWRNCGSSWNITFYFQCCTIYADSRQNNRIKQLAEYCQYLHTDNIMQHSRIICRRQKAEMTKFHAWRSFSFHWIWHHSKCCWWRDRWTSSTETEAIQNLYHTNINIPQGLQVFTARCPLPSCFSCF